MMKMPDKATVAGVLDRYYYPHISNIELAAKFRQDHPDETALLTSWLLMMPETRTKLPDPHITHVIAWLIEQQYLIP